MTAKELHQALYLIASDWKENPRYLEPGSLLSMMDDFADLYRHHLKRRPLSRMILSKHIRPVKEEAQELSAELQSMDDFFDEVLSTIYTLDDISVLQPTGEAVQREYELHQRKHSMLVVAHGRACLAVGGKVAANRPSGYGKAETVGGIGRNVAA